MPDRTFLAVEALVRRVQRVPVNRPDPSHILTQTIGITGKIDMDPYAMLGVLAEDAVQTRIQHIPAERQSKATENAEWTATRATGDASDELNALPGRWTDVAADQWNSIMALIAHAIKSKSMDGNASAGATIKTGLLTICQCRGPTLRSSRMPFSALLASECHASKRGLRRTTIQSQQRSVGGCKLRRLTRGG